MLMAMNEEMQSLEKNEMWDLFLLPKGGTLVCLYKKKK